MAVLLVGSDEGLDFFRGGVAEEIIAHTGMQIDPHQHRLGSKLHQLNLASIGLLHDEPRS